MAEQSFIELMTGRISDILWSYAALQSIPSFLCSFLFVLVAFSLTRPGFRRRPFYVIKRFFPRKIWFSKSSRLDMIYLLVNTFVLGGVVIAASMTYEWVGARIYLGIEAQFGAPEATSLPVWLCTALITLNLYLAYELAYWINHYTCHKVPFLWEFHKVHHSPKVLTPISNWRMHPVDTALFFNTTALFMGATQAVTNYALGIQTAPVFFSGFNILYLVYLYLYGHVQHSQLWITFGNKAGKIFMSPAAHQVHHSLNPVHFDKNFGGALSIYDWLFGTLHLPSKRREVTDYGLPNDPLLDHFASSMLHPFVGSAKRMLPKKLRKREDGSASTVTTTRG